MKDGVGERKAGDEGNVSCVLCLSKGKSLLSMEAIHKVARREGAMHSMLLESKRVCFRVGCNSIYKDRVLPDIVPKNKRDSGAGRACE